MISLKGDQWLEEVIIKNIKSSQEEAFSVKGLFYAIGHTPNTSLFQAQLQLDKKGYLFTEPGTPETSEAGVFAAGDVADSQWRQGVTAAGSGGIGEGRRPQADPPPAATATGANTRRPGGHRRRINTAAGHTATTITAGDSGDLPAPLRRQLLQGPGPPRPAGADRNGRTAGTGSMPLFRLLLLRY